jgi:CHAT domain-containing protein
LSADRNITTGNITLGSATQRSGEPLVVNAPGSIRLGNITAQGADIQVGDITAPSDLILSDNIDTGGASLELLSDRTFSLLGDLSTNGGDFFLQSNRINIVENLQTNGGNITLRGDTIDARNGRLDSSAVGSGGDIELTAVTEIRTGIIDSSSETGDGGDVAIDPRNDIEVGFINAEGGNSGRGGDVSIETDRFFRATQSFQNRNGDPASISTIGGQGDGSISIEHGGRGVTPFEIGNADLNGTDEAITSGEVTLSPPRSLPFTYREGNIQIVTGGSDRNFDPVERDSNQDNPIVDPSINPPRRNDVPIVAFNIITGSSGITFEGLEIVTTSSFQQYLELSNEEVRIKTLSQAQRDLREVENAEIGVKPALIYALFVPAESVPDGATSTQSDALKQDRSEITWQFTDQGFELDATVQQQIQAQINRPEREDDQLELIVVRSTGEPLRYLTGVTRAQVRATADQLREAVRADNAPESPESWYLLPAQQLYNWMIKPLEERNYLTGINTIAFVMDSQLRSLPLATLHDGHNPESSEEGQFLIEKYSIGLMPSLSLTEADYRGRIQDASVLATGASTIRGGQTLPAAEVEVREIVDNLWRRGRLLPPNQFTAASLRAERQNNPFGIVHLATHAAFSGELDTSYIAFSDGPLRISRLRDLDLDSSVELLVLSACTTALGDDQAELGFAGLAVKAGVRSALASLWYVGDVGTLALMTEFYRQLTDAPIKAEALQQAQIAMLQGYVGIEGSELRSGNATPITLPEQIQSTRPQNFRHPYYWSAFTLIGSPW